LLAWHTPAVESVKYDREELTIVVQVSSLREACALLRDDPSCQFNLLADLTCVDWYPAEPRFEVIYNLFSIPRKERVRLKVKLDSSSPVVESVTSLWPGANYFEREVFDLFGVRFSGHPYLRRILMPEDWNGNPLRKDYPVEGYR
jgi:NADH-quinone oxidoreductase subunit C